MIATVRPRTKLLAALMTAGMVSAAPAVSAHPPVPALSTAVVRPASVVTDVLTDVGVVAGAAANVVAVGGSALLALPFNALYAGVNAFGDPTATASLLSNLVQQYLNPVWNDAQDPYAVEFTQQVLLPLAGLLPTPFGTDLVAAINAGAAAAGAVLTNLPDPTTGLNLVNQFTSATDIGRLLYATQMAVYSPLAQIATVIGWLGDMPADIEATVESALRDPSEIPGLLSHLAYDVLDPKKGLLGQVATWVVFPLSLLPGPIGDDPAPGMARTAYNAFTDAVTTFLKDVLPTPVTPTPFPSSSTPDAAADAQAAVTSAVPSRTQAALSDTAVAPVAPVRTSSAAARDPGATAGNRKATPRNAAAAATKAVKHVGVAGAHSGARSKVHAASR